MIYAAFDAACLCVFVLDYASDKVGGWGQFVLPYVEPFDVNQFLWMSVIKVDQGSLSQSILEKYDVE